MKLPTLVLIAAVSIATLLAEDKPPGSVYRVDFTIHETTQGQKPTDRHYTVLLEPNTWGRISTGMKIPYLVEKDKYNYAEIGVNINCTLHEQADRLSLTGKFELSSLASEGNLPRIEQVRSEMSAPVPLGKPTRVVSLDDSTAVHHYDIDVVITKL